MNIHKNARLTPQGRHLLVRRVGELGWQMTQAAEAAGISQRQGFRWLARYRSGGGATLGDRSSAPGCCKHRIGAERISELTALREQRMSGPAIARQLGMPVSTVGAILQRSVSQALAALEQSGNGGYERQRPGRSSISTAKLGRIAGSTPPHHKTELGNGQSLSQHPGGSTADPAGRNARQGEFFSSARLVLPANVTVERVDRQWFGLSEPGFPGWAGLSAARGEHGG
jgi:hypothetical protein